MLTPCTTQTLVAYVNFYPALESRGSLYSAYMEIGEGDS